MAATSKDVIFGAANIQYSELTTRWADQIDSNAVPVGLSYSFSWQ